MAGQARINMADPPGLDTAKGPMLLPTDLESLKKAAEEQDTNSGLPQPPETEAELLPPPEPAPELPEPSKTDTKTEANEPTQTDPQPDVGPAPSDETQADPKTTDIPESPQLPPSFSLTKLPLELSLQGAEKATAIAAHGANLYIGTSGGNIHHFHLFDDAPCHILLGVVSAGGPVAKLLVVEDAGVCLALASNTIAAYGLADLSAGRGGKIKDAVDVLLLHVGRLKQASTKADKVIVYTGTRLRVIECGLAGFKLLRDIAYSGAVAGVSSAQGTLAHYSNICVVANKASYDVVDMQQTRKIPLFDHASPTPLIVPFRALDRSAEEYLLTVSSGGSSMAMFIDASGNATRGTLPWPDRGAPASVSVVWPHVFALFGDVLVVASLTTLAVVAEAPLSSLMPATKDLPKDEKWALLALGLPASVVDSSLSEALFKVTLDGSVSHSYKHVQAKVFFVGAKSIAYLHKIPQYSTEVSKISEKLSSGNFDLADNIAYFAKANDASAPAIHFALVCASSHTPQTKKEEKIRALLPQKQLDPRLLLLYFDFDASDPLWADFSAPQIVITILTANRQPLSDELLPWLISHEVSTCLDPQLAPHLRRLSYTVGCTTEEQVLDRLVQEKAVWQGENDTNKLLVSYFEDSHLFALLQVYLFKQEIGNTFQAWSAKILHLALDLLRQQESGTVQIGAHTFNLVDTVFDQLENHVDDELVYTTSLLELLKLRPEEALNLLQAHKKGKFSNTRRHILAQVAEVHAGNPKLSSLKVEYLEQALQEALDQSDNSEAKLAAELLQEFCSYLSHEQFADERQNLGILFSTYKVENDLGDPEWPKITWPGFLLVNHRKTECQEYLKAYLKAYELVLYTKPELELALPSGDDPSAEAMRYLNRAASSDNSCIAYLQTLGDYSAAEAVAVLGCFPVPRKLLLLRSIAESTLPQQQVEDNVALLLQTYLELEDAKARTSAVLHLTETQGRHLDVDRLLAQVPGELPLSCVSRFLTAKLVELEDRRQDAYLVKQLAKLDARTHREALVDFKDRWLALLDQDVTL